MIRKLAGLAPFLLATAACHSGGTYLSSAEPMPYGPGVVDCSWFQRTENAYVRERCMSPGPVAEVYVGHDSMARAPRGDQRIGCGEPEVVFVPTEISMRRAPAPAAAPAPTVSRGAESRPADAYVRPGVAYEGSQLPDWDEPVPPPRPGAPLPSPRGTYGR
jgi:hypothetical protein